MHKLPNSCRKHLGIVAISLVLLAALSLRAAPPFSGTIFLDPDIVVETDPSSFTGLEDAGRGVRTMFDRRVNGWVELNAFLFNARFDDDREIEVQVNPEFQTPEKARTEALRYLHAVGQLPAALRRDVRTIWIHQGREPFGGGNNNLLIHSSQADEYITSGILEETFIHEAAHTSLDSDHAAAPGWIAAQQDDQEFISTYARDNPTREDIAESYLPYFAFRFRPDRISDDLRNIISQAIPARIAYFDAQNFEMHPVAPLPPLKLLPPDYDQQTEVLTLRWTSRPGERYAVEHATNLDSADGWSVLAPEIPSEGAETHFTILKDQLHSLRWFRIRKEEDE